MNIQQRTWEILDVANPGDKTSRVWDISISALIFLNVIAVIIGSMASIQARWSSSLWKFEVISITIFTIEYLARLWSCTCQSEFKDPIRGRLRFIFRPMTLIDLAAILPFYLPFLGLDLRSLRALRLFRLIRLAKVGRYYSSLNLIKKVLRSKKEELVLSTALLCLLLVMSSSILFYCENAAQPEAFSSIPAAMWWSVITLTTVGYGDMYPITLAGKICASFIAILGIGMFALPTGILGAGFVEAVGKKNTLKSICPKCGEEIS